MSLCETSNNDDSDSVDDKAEVDEEEESSDESMGEYVRREPCSRNDKHKPKWAYNLRTDEERNKKRQNNPNIDVSSSNSTSSNLEDSEFEPG